MPMFPFFGTTCTNCIFLHFCNNRTLKQTVLFSLNIPVVYLYQSGLWQSYLYLYHRCLYFSFYLYLSCLFFSFFLNFIILQIKRKICWHRTQKDQIKITKSFNFHRCCVCCRHLCLIQSQSRPFGANFERKYSTSPRSGQL